MFATREEFSSSSIVVNLLCKTLSGPCAIIARDLLYLTSACETMLALSPLISLIEILPSMAHKMTSTKKDKT